MSDLPIVVSFGGGVQSTALAWLVLNDDPRIRAFGRPSLWIFADTGDEPQRVYDHVAEWRGRIEAAGMGFDVVTGRHGRLSTHCLTRAVQDEGGLYANIPPLFVMTKSGPGPALRGCTTKFKIAPIRKRMRRLGSPVRLWLGISRDEVHRMRTSDVNWVTNVYPLVEAGLRRTDCIRLLKQAGLTAPRSACVFCPYHSDQEWRTVRKDPGDWARALAFERSIHAAYDAQGRVFGLDAKPYLHRSLTALDAVDLDAQEGFGWGNDCSGVCGV